MNSASPLVVGVDLGTTETKAVLTTPAGNTLGHARRPTTWQRTSDGRYESTGAALTGDVLATVRDALAGYQDRTGRPARVAALGIAGLAESGVLLDARGQESAPVIAWFDDRGGDELRAQDAGFLAAFPARTGLPVHAQWTLPKLLWLLSAGLRLDASSRWLNVPEFVAWTLTGHQVSEPSLASRTGLLDQATMQPWDEALALLGVTAALLPDRVPAGTAAGRVGHCSELPELAGALVTVAGHDHPVAAVGAGATGPEDLFNSCGTAEVLVRSVPRVLDDAERTTLVGLGLEAGRHVLPGHSMLLAGMRSGLVMNRVLTLIGATTQEARAAVDQRWRPGGAAASGVRVTGASVDDSDVTLRLGADASPDAVWSATLEHVAEQASRLLTGVTGVVGEHRSAVAAGGWTRLRSVRETKARLIPRLTFCPVDQPGTRGAALLAASALGEGSLDELTRRFALSAGGQPELHATRSPLHKEHTPS